MALNKNGMMQNASHVAWIKTTMKHNCYVNKQQLVLCSYIDYHIDHTESMHNGRRRQNHKKHSNKNKKI